jgi:hypothetical protein
MRKEYGEETLDKLARLTMEITIIERALMIKLCFTMKVKVCRVKTIHLPAFKYHLLLHIELIQTQKHELGNILFLVWSREWSS